MLKPLLVCFVLWQVCLGANLAAFEIEFEKESAQDGNTCKEWQSELHSAYDEVAELAAASMKDLQVVSQKRPDKGNLKDYENWNRIDRNLMQFFGFSVDEKKPDPNSGYLKDVLGKNLDRLLATEHRLIFIRMVRFNCSSRRFQANGRDIQGFQGRASL